MSLKPRNGKWCYQFKLDGQRYRRTTGLAATERNRKAAQLKEADAIKDLMEGRNPAARRVEVREFSSAAKEFLDWAEKHHRAHPNTYKRVKTSFSSLKAFFGREPVSRINAARVEAYMSWRIREHDVRDVTLRHDVHSLSKFFRHAITQSWAVENPAVAAKVGIPSDKEAVRKHVLTETEEKQYFSRAAKLKNQNLHDVGRLILNQGMRPEEVTQLRKDDIDLERGQLHVRQGKTEAATRTLVLTAESKLILGRRMAGASQWVFPMKSSKKEQTDRPVPRVNSAHDRLCAKALEDGVKLDFVIYDLRHTFATRLAELGTDLGTLAEILGHNSIRVIQKYVHPTDDHKSATMLRYSAWMEAKQTEGRIQ